MSFGANAYQDFNETAPAVNEIGSWATAGIPGKDDERKIFVGGLTWQTSEKELRDYFGTYGQIESMLVKMDAHIRQSGGFAFILFSDAKSVAKVVPSKHYINGRKVYSKPVVRKAQHGKVFVSGLTPAITDEDIRNHFSQYGTILEIQGPLDKARNQRKGFCFITFENGNVIYHVLKFPKQYIRGKAVIVKKVKKNPEGAALNPNAIMGRPNISSWGKKPPFPGGYPPECSAPYPPPAYSNHGEYATPLGNDYPSYGYSNVDPNQPFGAKSMGPAHPFRRYHSH